MYGFEFVIEGCNYLKYPSRCTGRYMMRESYRLVVSISVAGSIENDESSIPVCWYRETPRASNKSVVIKPISQWGSFRSANQLKIFLISIGQLVIIRSAADKQSKY
jgi:hypothetical protein